MMFAKPIASFKILQTMEGEYSIRAFYPGFPDEDREVEFHRTGSEQEANEICGMFKAILNNVADANSAACIAVSVLLRTSIIMHTIANTGDTTTDANYATKRHMRAWAQDALSQQERAMNILLREWKKRKAT